MNPQLDPVPDPGAIGAAAGDLSRDERERLRAREPGALGRFYDLYFERVYAYLRRLVREEHLAEDLTQEVFMHVHRSLPTYDPARALRPWVFTIATNKVRDHWRSRRHTEAQQEVRMNEDESGPPAVSPLRGPAARLEASEVSELVAETVAELPEGLKTTLLLRFFEGLSFEEIGRIVDRNETAVRKRYSRALEELRKRLGNVLDGA